MPTIDNDEFVNTFLNKTLKLRCVLLDDNFEFKNGKKCAIRAMDTKYLEIELQKKIDKKWVDGWAINLLDNKIEFLLTIAYGWDSNEGDRYKIRLLRTSHLYSMIKEYAQNRLFNETDTTRSFRYHYGEVTEHVYFGDIGVHRGNLDIDSFRTPGQVEGLRIAVDNFVRQYV